ncbi:MAG: hypothetical protein QG626_445 [Patescibacteria group bacterium]|jgi:predicted component of type VI protein secretion system|nr:hypothetical protein [Patescibacteria group bacterium]
MPSRKKIEVIVAVVVLVLLAILLYLATRQPAAEPQVSDLPQAQSTSLPPVDPKTVPAPGVVSAGTVARTFIERFGSYSSETDFANVDDVMKLATPTYQSELDTLVNGYRRQFDAEAGYTGVSTQVISMKTVTETDAATTFLVTTQREEAVGTPGNTTLRYQDAEVNLIKSGDSWLVNDLTWK